MQAAGGKEIPKVDTEGSDGGPVLGRIVGLLRPYLGRFFLATLLLILGSGIGLAYPQAARFAVDDGLAAAGNLDLLAVGMVGIFLVQAVLTWLRHYLMSWLGNRVVADLRRQVMDRLVALPAEWFHERHTGELVGRITGDVTILEGVVGSELSIALRNLVQLIGGFVLLFLADPTLTVATLLIVPPMIIAVMLFGRRIRRMSRAVRDAVAEASSRVQEVFGAITTVQAFRRERSEAARYGEKVEAVFDRERHLAVWRATFISTASLSGFMALGGLVYLGGRRVAAGEMTAGELTAFLLYSGLIAVALGSLTGLWAALQRAAGATTRLFEIIDTVPTIADPKTPVAPKQSRGKVRFSGVHFSYPSRPELPVLEDINLEIEPGRTVALVGPSGAGKSTLTALVPRFFDVAEGKVEVAGVDVRQLSLEALRSGIAIVPQTPVLFSGTIAENIAYGAPEATEAQIKDAARRANAHDFIEAFPDGYNTLCGERGAQLSGGQRQRVAIARALLMDPELLILDEATSNLDAESEALVQQALKELMGGRTTLIIAHRLSTVRDADRIVVLDGGRIVEQGDHYDLLAAGGLYKRLVEHQLLD